MRKVWFIALIVCVLVTLSRCAPVDQKDSPREAQSAFVPAFDEIVVESSLTVRRKNDSGRQGRNKNAPNAATSVKPTSDSGSTNTRPKRQISGFPNFSGNNRQPPPFWNNLSGSASNAHAQNNAVTNLLSNFGSSATHAQNQAFQLDRNGLSTSANIAATQHYYFPSGMKVDVNFAAGQRNSDASASTSSVTTTHPSGYQTHI